MTSKNINIMGKKKITGKNAGKKGNNELSNQEN